jgi:GLPGLI family protein
MNRRFLVLLVLLSFLSLQHISAQGFKVVYEEFGNLSSGRDVGKYLKHIENPEVRAYVEKQISTPLVRTSELVMNECAVLYKVNKEPEKTDTVPSERIFSYSRQRNSVMAIYKNYADSTVLTQSSMDNKVYLLESPIVSGTNEGWEITSEEQDILGYKCIKATKGTGEAQKIGNMTVRSHKTVAWYCPDIPVDAGPENHSGLPGLILKVEVGEGLSAFTAISIEQIDSATEIPKPEEGEKVSNEQFLAIVSEYIARRREQMKQGDGNVIFIQE